MSQSKKVTKIACNIAGEGLQVFSKWVCLLSPVDLLLLVHSGVVVLLHHAFSAIGRWQHGDIVLLCLLSSRHRSKNSYILELSFVITFDRENETYSRQVYSVPSLRHKFAD